MMSAEKFSLLGVGVANVKEHEVLEFIVTGLEKQTEKYYIVTPNPELLVIADNNPKYKDVLNGARLALADGIGIVWGAQLLGHPLKERIHGVDLMESLCSYVSKQPITVGFLGAGPGIAEKTAECLQERFPGLRVGLISKEWDVSLNSQKIDILFVAFGSPKQEIWMADHLNSVSAKVLIGVGGAFDFVSGTIPRAPKFIRRFGLEWLFRLFVQPWRIKRQLSLLKFVYLVLKEKYKR